MTTLLILAALALPQGPGDGPSPPSPREMSNLFRKNFDAFRSLEVQWRRDQGRTAEWAAMQERTYDRLAAAIEAAGTGVENEHELRQQLNNQRQVILEGRRSKSVFQTFLTDRTRFMLRTAPPNWGFTHGDDSWLMPDVPVTATSLKATYAGFAVLSYAGAPTQGFRNWVPQSYPPMGSGQKTRLNPTGEAGQFPPLGVDRADWGKEWHPIDAFFKDGPESLRTVGLATVDGHETVVVERRTKNEHPRSFLTEAEFRAHGSRVEQFEVARAYLDPRSGGLPRKIEWDIERFYDGKPLPRPGSSRPYRVLDGVEIVAVEGAGFYPVRGRDQLFGQDPKWTGPMNTFGNELAGRVHDFPMVVHEETTWHAAMVKGDITPDETFSLPFPDGSYYYDEISGRTELAGREGRDEAWLPRTLLGVVLAGWVVYGVATLATAMLLRRRPRPVTDP